MKKTKISHTIIIRFVIFCTLYFAINSFYGDFTSNFFNYRIGVNDGFVIWIFPLTILALILIGPKDYGKKIEKQRLKDTLTFALLCLLVFAIPFLKPYIPSGANGTIRSFPMVVILFYTQMILANLLLFLAVFNLNFTRKFQSKTLLLPIPAILYISAQFLVENHWKVFSGTIIKSLGYILPLFNKSVYVNPATFNVKMEKFSVIIGPPCSGIFSIFTLILLFLVSMAVISRTREIQKLKAFISLIIGLTVIFILNIVRISIIIMVGAYISADLAIKIFHEYLSAIFLIALFMFYLYKVIPQITTPLKIAKK